MKSFQNKIVNTVIKHRNKPGMVAYNAPHPPQALSTVVVLGLALVSYAGTYSGTPEGEVRSYITCIHDITPGFIDVLCDTRRRCCGPRWWRR